MCFGTGCVCDYLVSLCVKKHGCLHCKFHCWLWDKGWSQISRWWSVVFKPQVLRAGNYTKEPNYSLVWIVATSHHLTLKCFFSVCQHVTIHLIYIYIHMRHTYAICASIQYFPYVHLFQYIQQSLGMSNSTGISGSDIKHPTFRNRPHMHHAIEPWMAQVRVLELLRQRNHTLKQKLTNVGLLSLEEIPN